MNNNIIAIIADGERVNAYEDILCDVDIIIAADGGANLCRSQQITPHFIIGDLDSITSENLQFFSKAKLIKSSDQSTTDMQKAIDYALKLNPSVIKIISAYGMRTDHTIGNLLIFQNYQNSVPLKIHDNFGIMSYLTAGEHKLTLQPGQGISFFSLSAIEDLTLDGFEYQLNNAKYPVNFIGISNRAVKTDCTVKFKKGKLITYVISI